MSNSTIDRRQFLRSATVAIPLPLMASLGASAAPANKDAAVKRFICVMPEYGIYRGSLVQAQPGPLEFTQYSAPLKPFAKDITVLSGLDHPGVGGGHGCSATLLNGMSKYLIGGDRRKMQSLDMLLADRVGGETRFRNLATGNGAPISYNNKGIALPKISTPRKLFDMLFHQQSAKQRQAMGQSIDTDRSILDSVVQDAKSLKTKLGAHDKDKFEEYLTALRATEEQLASDRSWIEKPKPVAPRNPFAATDDEAPHDFELFYDVIGLAVQTDSSRIYTYQMPGGNGFLPIDGVTTAYHTLTHHGRKPEFVHQLGLVDQWRFSQLARLLKFLKQTKDVGGRPLLDTTVVMFASGMADASVHSPRNVPVLLAGGPFKHGAYHAMPDGKDSKKDSSLCNLYVSILQQFGLDIDAFSSSNGNLNELLG
jgi:hypothetical protein